MFQHLLQSKFHFVNICSKLKVVVALQTLASFIGFMRQLTVVPTWRQVQNECEYHTMMRSSMAILANERVGAT